MLFLSELLKCAFALWLGTFVLTRNWQQSRTQMIAAALIVWAVTPFCAAMLFVGGSPAFWLRGMVGVWPISVGLFFGLTLSLTVDILPDQWRSVMRLIYRAVVVAGIVLGVFAAFTGRIFDFTTARMATTPYLSNYFERLGSAEFLYNGFTLAVPIAGVSILTLTNWGKKRIDLRYVTAASWLWLLGLLMQRVLYADRGATSAGLLLDNLTDPVFMLAYLLLGYGIVRHSAFVDRPIARADFIISLFGLGLVLVVFALLPLGIGRSRYLFTEGHYFLILLATTLAVITHTVIDLLRRRVDTLLLGTPDALLREEIGTTLDENRAGRPLDETLEELATIGKRAMIREQVSKGLLRQLGSADSLTELANSPLLILNVAQAQLTPTASNLEKANAIHALLDQAFTQIETTTPSPTPRQTELHQLLALRLRDGLDRPDITRRLHLHERKYDRLLAQGVAQLADALIALEESAERPSPPSPLSHRSEGEQSASGT